MSDADLQVTPISDGGDWRFAPIAELYERAFPPSERKPTAFLNDVVVRSDYVLLAATIAEEIAGFSVLYVSNAGFGLLEYMAVNERLRGHGVGGKLFRETARHCPVPMVLEVEAPDEGVDSIEARRVEFYRRLGCRMVPQLCYRMPQLGAELPPPMRLMLTNYAPDAIAKSQLGDWIGGIYSGVYGRPASDPSAIEMLSPLPDCIEL
ncbi:N-acetyltransferase [Tsuneonella suprasediminis]|uniref:N-acetyltransferase n=1 Tax=Tsuneonella suprasediminis TaxID=2306996 RepID=A0A419R2A8_9SPHN|nr:GNAT family N-acetyltransferase [Tsuneonella suprasediminis]RJX68107.1 N-acetyltransferase [Tsuneonella suprasediminis]